jgi:prepilin signal peptidase PulO-like enzyme (type II secretory pathway)
MKGRVVLYTGGFILMTLIAALDFVLLVGRLIPLRGRWLPFMLSLPIVGLGGYVGWVVGGGLGLSHDDVLNMGAAVSVISGFLLLMFFLL